MNSHPIHTHKNNQNNEPVELSSKVPPILYLSNKSEDGFEGDILSDFYRRFPEITTAVDPTTLQPYDPIFISAEHGDGLPDLFQKIEAHIPYTASSTFEERKLKRINRYLEFKELMLDEIVDIKTEEMEKKGNLDSALTTIQDEKSDTAIELREFVASWEKEFDLVNGNAEENSDFDSDNEINPLDTLDSLGRYMSSKS